MVIYGDLMVIYGDLMGFTGNLMGFTRPGKLTVCELENGHWNSGFSH